MELSPHLLEEWGLGLCVGNPLGAVVLREGLGGIKGEGTGTRTEEFRCP